MPFEAKFIRVCAGGKMVRRSHIIVNMAMSADGKISTFGRESFPLGSREDRRLMDRLRARADAVVIGSGTFRVDGFPLLVREKELVRKRLRRGLPPHPLNVVVSSSLDLPLAKPFFHHPDTTKLVITTTRAEKRRLQRIEHLAEVAIVRAKTITPARIVSILAARKMGEILVEGGGELNFSFFEAGLVHEIYLTVTPQIIGGRKSPTVADGRGFLAKDRVPLKLLSARRKGDEIFLRYRVKRKR